jgi:putative SOS response-associated peptidase YedK
MSKLVDQFALKNELQLPLRFNIAPTQSVAAVRAAGPLKERELVALRWGLVPSWAKDPAIGNQLINARAESVADKASFRSAFKRRRCLVLADGYYEWQKQGKKKQPFLIHMDDHRPFAFAGLWEQWFGLEGQPPLESCTIITTQANDFTSHVHDRMPVILDEHDYDLWLDPDVQDRSRLEPLLVPHVERMAADPVSTHVNNARNEGEKCIEPLVAPPSDTPLLEM